MFGLFQKHTGAVIERIGADQSEDCAALHAASFSFPWPHTDIEALLLSPSVYAEGAFGRPRVLEGFILSRLAADEAEILTIAVKPRKRGQGIAAKLMNANMEALKIAGAKSWFLEVEAQNTAALALYKRFGFEKVGDRKSYYRTTEGENALAYILRRSLR